MIIVYSHFLFLRNYYVSLNPYRTSIRTIWCILIISFCILYPVLLISYILQPCTLISCILYFCSPISCTLYPVSLYYNILYPYHQCSVSCILYSSVSRILYSSVSRISLLSNTLYYVSLKFNILFPYVWSSISCILYLCTPYSVSPSPMCNILYLVSCLQYSVF